MDVPPLVYGDFAICTRSDGSPYTLGEGTSGVTYKGVRRELVFGQPIETFAAIKVFKPGRVESERQQAHFYRELSVLSSIQHPNVVRYLKQGEANGEVYYAMEFCGGGTLEDFCLKSGGLTPAQLAGVATQVLDGLAVLHSAGFVHCDLKPSNLLIDKCSGGTQLIVKLSDFGSLQPLSTNADSSAGGAETALSAEPFRGSPLFASPEQIKEHHLDQRSDIYSLGITLWFLALGRRPFDGAVREVQFWHLDPRAHVVTLPEAYPPALNDVLRWLLEKSQANRPTDLTEIKRKFAPFLGESPASLPVSTTASANTTDSIDARYDVSNKEQMKHPLGYRCPATRRDTREQVFLTFIDETLATMPKMDEHWQAWEECSRRKDLPSGLLPVRAFHRDGCVIATDHRTGTPLSRVLSNTGGQLEVPDTLKLLDGIAVALDFLDARDLRGVSLAVDDLLVAEIPHDHSARDRDQLAWQVLMDPTLTLPAALRPTGAQSVDSSHTITTVSGFGGGSGDRDTPHAIAFLALLYRLSVGRELSDAAFINASAYTPTQKLGDQTNELIRNRISSTESPIPTCRALLDRIIENEGLSFAEIAQSGKRIHDSMVSRTMHPPEASRLVASAAVSPDKRPPPIPPPLPPVTGIAASQRHKPMPRALALGGGGLLLTAIAVAWIMGHGKPKPDIGPVVPPKPNELPGSPQVKPPTIPVARVPATLDLPEGTNPAQPVIRVNGRPAQTQALGRGFSIILEGATSYPVEVQFSAPGYQPHVVVINPDTPTRLADMLKLKRTEGKIVLAAPPGGTDFTSANFKFLRPLLAERDHVPASTFSIDKSLLGGESEASYVLPSGVYKVVLRGDHPERLTPRILYEEKEVYGTSLERFQFPPSIAGQWMLKAGDARPALLILDQGLGGGSLKDADGKVLATVGNVSMPDSNKARISLDSPSGPIILDLGFPDGKSAGATYVMDKPMPGMGQQGGLEKQSSNQ